MVSAKERPGTPLSYAASLRTLAVLTGVGLSGCGTSSEPILIGLAGPFSQQTAQSMLLAAQLAASEINQQGGVNGRQLQLVVQDDSGMGDVAVQVARSFYDDPDIVAVVGHMNSRATLAAARVYNGGDKPVVEISPSASSPEVSDAGPYTFRVCPDDEVHGTQLADWAYRHLATRRVAVLYENDAYGRGLRATFSREFAGLGGQIVTQDPFSTVLPSFEPYLTRIRLRGGADAILFAGALEEAERMLSTINVLRLDQTILSGDGVGGIETSDVDAEGTFVSLAYVHDQPGTRNEAFTSAYQRATGGQLPDHRGAGAYDIVYLLSHVIEEVGTNRQRVRDYLSGIGTETDMFSGVTGSIGFDANGDIVGRNVVIAVVQDNRLVSAAQR